MASQVNVFRVAGINREIWVTQGEVAACFQLGWFWLVPFWNRIWAVVISDQSFSSFRKREEHCGADTGVDFHIDAVVTRLIFLVVLSYSRWSWWEKEEIWNVSKKTAWFFSSWQVSGFEVALHLTSSIVFPCSDSGWVPVAQLPLACECVWQWGVAAQKFAPEWLSSVTSVLGRYWKLPLSQRCDASVPCTCALQWVQHWVAKYRWQILLMVQKTQLVLWWSMSK